MANVLLLGYGRMGKMIEQVLLDRGHTVGHIHQRADELNESSWCACDVAIEFSVPQAAEHLCQQALRWGIPTVSGSTGWDITATCALVAQANPPPAFLHATNMSIGVNAVFAANRLLARVLAQAPVESASIQETHHVHKLDRPSGTAITLAEGIVDDGNRYTDWALDTAEPIDPSTLPVTSVREGEVYGDHEVAYTTASEVIHLRHHATSRKGFATGAVLAAEFLQGKSGRFTMADVLGIP